MGKSKIDWTDYTWNPIVGCSKISPGCVHCYAETMANRRAAMEDSKISEAMEYLPPGTHYERKYSRVINKGGWNGSCYLSESELEKPFHWKSSRRIFVSSMGDLFHENVPFEWIDQVMAVITLNPRHTFMILTKRVERMAEYFLYKDIIEDRADIIADMAEKLHLVTWDSRGDNDALYSLVAGYKPGDAKRQNRRPWPGWPLPNLWLGVTAENQEMADLRIPILLRIPAALRFVSIEPMLELIEIEEYLPQFDHRYEYDFFQEFQKACGEVPDGKPIKIKDGLDWVILGMETGPGARMFPGAAEAIVKVKDQCQEVGVPFFYKGPQHIGIAKSNYPGPKYFFWYEAGNREKGYTIDGIEYRQFPEVKK